MESQLSSLQAPQGIVNFTYRVDPNEKVYYLYEQDIMPKSATGLHRYQVMYVNRSDELAAFVRDLGSVGTELVGEFTFPCLWEYSVAEAADIAEQWREESGMKQKLDERAEKSTLMKDHQLLQEIKNTAMKRNPVTMKRAIQATSEAKSLLEG